MGLYKSIREKTKFFTLMLVPHTGDSTRSIKLNNIIILIFLFFMACLMVLTLYFGYVFTERSNSLANYQEKLLDLEEENGIQKQEIDRLASETEQLVEKVFEVENIGAKIKEMLEQEEVNQGTEFGTGGAIPNEELPDMYNRGMVSSRSSRVAAADSNIDILKESLYDKVTELESLIDDFEKFQEILAVTPSIWPTKGRVTSSYGYRNSPFTNRREFHEGLDIGAPSGTPIYATADGRVSVAAYNGAWGRLVIINHGREFSTYYAHLSRFAVSDGEVVEKGDLIGYVGSTGRSTGPHVHYEVHQNGNHVNPSKYLP